MADIRDEYEDEDKFGTAGTSEAADSSTASSVTILIEASAESLRCWVWCSF